MTHSDWLAFLGSVGLYVIGTGCWFGNHGPTAKQWRTQPLSVSQLRVADNQLWVIRGNIIYALGALVFQIGDWVWWARLLAVVTVVLMLYGIRRAWRLRAEWLAKSAESAARELEHDELMRAHQAQIEDILHGVAKVFDMENPN